VASCDQRLLAKLKELEVIKEVFRDFPVTRPAIFKLTSEEESLQKEDC
jgi:hypothetical protein